MDLMRVLLVLLSWAFHYSASGQLMDSIAYFHDQERVFIAKLDMRGSFVRNEQVKIFGAKVGFEHAGRLQYGIGYSMLLSPVERLQQVEGVGEVRTRLRMGYVDPYIDYAFFRRGPWEIRLPVQIGIGSGSLIYNDVSGERQVLKKSTLFFYEPAMTVQYQFWKYLAIGAGWGFRLAIHTSSDLGENLSAPTYTFGLRVFFGEVWKDVRGEMFRGSGSVE